MWKYLQINFSFDVNILKEKEKFTVKAKQSVLQITFCHRLLPYQWQGRKFKNCKVEELTKASQEWEWEGSHLASGISLNQLKQGSWSVRVVRATSARALNTTCTCFWIGLQRRTVVKCNDKWPVQTKVIGSIFWRLTFCIFSTINFTLVLNCGH